MKTAELCSRLGRSLPPLFECTAAPQEGVRVRTPLMYPDGGVVDVFVLERNGGCQVTDFGEALGWLRMQSVSVRRSPKQNRMVEDACQTLGVELHHGQILLRSDAPESLGAAVLRVAQAAVRVSDLWFTLRTRSVETVAEEVHDWLLEREVSFERAVKQRGRSGRTWTIDYRTRTDDRTALVFLLSTGSRGAARRIAEHVLAGCVDLSHLTVGRPDHVFVSLFDDTQDIWREEEFSLVEQYSEIARWSRPDEFEQTLRAA